LAWEIHNGVFAQGRFNATFDIVSDGTTWPSGDVFDVIVPEPATMALLALGGLVIIRRR